MSSIEGKTIHEAGLRTVKGVVFFGGKLLLQLRDDNPKIFYPNHWGLFGGEVEPNESASEAIKRELLEELTLSECEEELLFSWKSPETGSQIMFFLITTSVQINRLTIQEGQKMGLFSFDGLHDLLLTPDLSVNIERLRPLFKSTGRLKG